MKLIRTLLTCVMLLTAGFAWANNKTFYGKATATTSGNGKVYVGTSSEVPADDQFSSGPVSAVASAEGGSSATSAQVTFYLFTKPDEGYKFDHWEKDGTKVNMTSSSYAISATSTDANNPTEHILNAIFTLQEGVVVTTDQPNWGSVTIDKVDNKVGDKVVLTATPMKVAGYGCANLVVKFKGWYDSDGNLLSSEPKYSFTVEKIMNIKGVFENKSTVVSGGYYRVRSSFNRVMTVEGKYKVGTNNKLPGLLSWTLPTGYVAADFNGKNFSNDTEPQEVETMPSTIIQLKGTPDGDKLINAVGYSQGTDTEKLTGQKFTVQHCQGMPTYYEIISGSLSLKHGIVDKTNAIVMVGNNEQNAYQFMAVQPISEDTVDDFWFGAHPDEAMEYDGGYWTSMYTSFPYKCYEPDGVEAYYIKECTINNGINCALLEKIESGIVPAETPVLLKCRSFESSKDNRLIPLDPDEFEISPVEYNMLAGVYQLNESKDNPNHKMFDENTMRVFGTNADGAVGFYKLAPNSDGTPAELLPNKAYFDLSKLPADAANAPIRIQIKNSDSSGVTIIGEPDKRPDDGVIYDLMGRRVSEQNLQPGTIYIRNGHKFIKR